ncbi:MAG: tetratricopeptide repeat protein [Maribacter sp.]
MKFTVKTTISVFCFLFLSTQIQSQTTRIDSLKRKLSHHTKNDTTRVNLLNALAYSQYEKDLERTTSYLEESEAIADAIDFKKGKARNLYIQGIIQYSFTNYKQAIELFKKALLVYEKIDFLKGVSDCYAAMGLVNYDKFDYNKSIEYYKKSIAIEKNIGQRRTTAISLKYIGHSYTDLGNYKKAKEYYNDAIDINAKYNNRIEMASCLKNIGSIYLKKGNYPLALEYYNNSLSIYKELKDTAGIGTIFNNTGIIYKNYENYDKAIDNYKESLKIEKKLDNKQNLAITLNNIGVVYKLKEDYKNALIYLNDALKISEKINDKDNTARCLINIGDVYLGFENNKVALQNFLEAKEINIEIGAQLGLCYSYLGIATVYKNEKKYNMALINAIKSKNISNKLGVIDYQRGVYKLLSIIYENTDNYEKAFESHQQFKILNDSLFNRKNIEKITQLEADYKYKRALDSASIRELKLTSTVKTTSQNLEKSQRNYLWAIIGVLLVSILLGGIIFYQKYRNVKSKNENIVIEQRLLRSQMTPHFMFNSLSVLQGMILNKEEGKSISYLSKFSKLLRTTLENSRHKLVALSDELSAVDSYMALQNLDVNPPFNYNLSIDSEINTTAFKIPPMLIQPFIENAIEHAFVTEKENKEITVNIALKNKGLVCTIADNGIGVSMEKPKIKKDKKSLATTITAERLKMLSKDFGVEGSVSVTNREIFSEQGTLVTLVIPYKINSVS